MCMCACVRQRAQAFRIGPCIYIISSYQQITNLGSSSTQGESPAQQVDLDVLIHLLWLIHKHLNIGYKIMSSNRLIAMHTRHSLVLFQR